MALAARNPAKLAALAPRPAPARIPAMPRTRRRCAALFEREGDAEVVVYNPSYRTRGPIAELDPAEVQRSLQVCAFGAFLAAQQAARRMVQAGHGTILLTGASAGVKGYPQSAPFAMGKFALRGLAQSMARELHPRGVHVAHVVIDGGIRSARRPEPGEDPARPRCDRRDLPAPDPPDRSAWSWEIEVRPWVEKF